MAMTTASASQKKRRPYFVPDCLLDVMAPASLPLSAPEEVPVKANLVRRYGRFLGVWLRLADVAAGFRLSGGASGAPFRLSPLALHPLPRLSRYARAARPRARPRTWRLLPRHGLPRLRFAHRGGDGLSARARDDEPRLSRKAPAGAARRHRRDGRGGLLCRRPRPWPVCRLPRAGRDGSDHRRRG